MEFFAGKEILHEPTSEIDKPDHVFGAVRHDHHMVKKEIGCSSH